MVEIAEIVSFFYVWIRDVKQLIAYQLIVD